MTPMIVRDTPWLRWGVNPSAAIRSRTCSTTSGAGCGFRTMIIRGPQSKSIVGNDNWRSLASASAHHHQPTIIAQILSKSTARFRDEPLSLASAVSPGKTILVRLSMQDGMMDLCQFNAKFRAHHARSALTESIAGGQSSKHADYQAIPLALACFRLRSWARAPPTCVARAPGCGTVSRPGHHADRRSPPGLTDRCGCHEVAQWDIFFPSRPPRSPWLISGCDDDVNRAARSGARLGSDRAWAILLGCRNFGKTLMHLAGISAGSRPNSQPQRQIKNPK